MSVAEREMCISVNVVHNCLFMIPLFSRWDASEPAWSYSVEWTTVLRPCKYN